MHLALDILLHAIAIPLVFLAATVAFDVVHWALHQAHGSSFAPLRFAGGLHASHHAFLDRELRVHEDLIGANLLRHVIPEFMTQVAFSALLLFVLPWTVVAGAFALQGLVFAVILRDRGLDVNHRGHEKLDAFRPIFFCVPEYHALHHVHPDAHFSSWIKLLDYALGRGLSLEGRAIAWVGGDDARRAAFARALGEAGVVEAHSVEDAEILAVTGALGSASIEDAMAAHRAAAEAGPLPREMWWLRPAGDAGETPLLGRRVQVRTLSSPAGAESEQVARRWLRRLRQGRTRA